MAGEGSHRPYLGVTDLRQQTLSMTTLPVAIGESQSISGVRVGSNGKAYLTLGRTRRCLSHHDGLHMAMNTERALPLAGSSGNTGAGLLTTSTDRSVVMLNAETPRCIQRYDVRTDTFSAISIGGFPYTALSKAGDVLFVALGKLGVVRLRTKDSAILDRTENTVGPTFLRVSPDGNTLVSVDGNLR